AAPSGPTLNTDSVMEADRVADDIQRQICNSSYDQIDGEEEQPLHPAPAQQAFSPGSQAGSGASCQQQPEEGQSPERTYYFEGKGDAAQGDGLGQLVGRQVIGLRAGGLCWGSRCGRRSLGRR